MILTFKIIDFSVEIIDCDMFHSSPCPRSRVIDFTFSKTLILKVKINDFEGAATDIDFGPGNSENKENHFDVEIDVSKIIDFETWKS